VRRGRVLPIVCLLTALALPACRSEEPVARLLTPVRVQQVETRETAPGLRYSANLEPNQSVNVAFKVDGYVASIRQEQGADGKLRDIQTGDAVMKGMVLAGIEDEAYRDKVKEADAQLGQANAALTKAESDHKRANALFSTQSMTAPEYDTYKKEYQSAQAAVRGARAQLDQAKLNVAYCQLTSPLDGIMLQRQIEVGTLVAPGKVAFVVADVSEVKAVFGVPDVMLADTRKGDSLSITTQSLSDQSFPGTVTSISAAADSSTRVFDVEVTVANPNGLLKPGMVAALDVPRARGESDAVAEVPISAIVRAKSDPKGYAVYVLDGKGSDAVVHMRDVSVGEIFGNSVAVTAGLDAGTTVVVYGATLVSDGERVRVIP
jgi:RND family efflux transporter MFP subunit